MFRLYLQNANLQKPVSSDEDTGFILLFAAVAQLHYTAPISPFGID